MSSQLPNHAVNISECFSLASILVSICPSPLRDQVNLQENKKTAFEKKTKKIRPLDQKQSWWLRIRTCPTSSAMIRDTAFLFE